MNRVKTVAPICAVLLMASSCVHKDLCFDHLDHASRYATDVAFTYELSWEQPWENSTDWQSGWDALGLGFSYNSLCPKVPEGIRLTSFNSPGMRSDNNLEPYGEEIYLSPGVNSLLFYNNDTEYIVFNDLDSYDNASAGTRARSRSTYTGNPLYGRGGSRADETTVNAPDVLFGHYIESYTQERVAQPQQLAVEMRPLVFTYVVRYHFAHGYNYVALARGAMSGMAESVYLSNGHTSKKPVTVLFDCTLEQWGVLATVRSFGIPDYPNFEYSRGDGSFALNLEVRLKNGKILNYYFDVTDQLLKQPHGGVITVDGIQVSDEDGGGSGGAFDVTVDGWGEFQDVPVEF